MGTEEASAALEETNTEAVVEGEEATGEVEGESETIDPDVPEAVEDQSSELVDALQA